MAKGACQLALVLAPAVHKVGGGPRRAVEHGSKDAHVRRTKPPSKLPKDPRVPT